ncbi:hypothetical protein [Streptomyces anandii]|uniref:Uncharacterized protein n=1 Tax=Streptomyces anandii TaxID=285454 RepID=A0ABW6HH70_9ACTN
MALEILRRALPARRARGLPDGRGAVAHRFTGSQEHRAPGA